MVPTTDLVMKVIPVQNIPVVSQFYSREFYGKLLTRFSFLDRFVMGLVSITLRVRKSPNNAVQFNSAKAEVWDILFRTSQKYFPPAHVDQLLLQNSKTGILVTYNRLCKYGLVRYYKAG